MATSTRAGVTGRVGADPPAGTVVFLIGMRINQPWRVDQWLPVLVAMPRMLVELRRRPDLGLLGAHLYTGGRTFLVVQYWDSLEHLTAYAADPDQLHLPAWRRFNRAAKKAGAVGIWHETYEVGRHESIYVGMPAGFGLAGATATVPVGRRGERAAHRLDPSVPDTPAVTSD